MLRLKDEWNKQNKEGGGTFQGEAARVTKSTVGGHMATTRDHRSISVARGQERVKELAQKWSWCPRVGWRPRWRSTHEVVVA